MATLPLLVVLTTLVAAALGAEPTVRTSTLKEWEVCTHRPHSCAPGLSCDGKRAAKRCIKYKPAGMGCPAKEEFWICAAGLVCQSNVCKIPAGKDCTATPTQCASGLSCDGKRAAKRCITYKPAGMGCPVNEDFWICAPGLTCQGNICKIPLGSNCASSPSNCVADAECTGSGGSRKCMPKPAKLGEQCNASKKCAHGLTCDTGVCKLPRGADCTATRNMCAAGLSCDGKRAAKRCITYKPAGMGCPANEDFWICAPGLTCEADVCKIPLGGVCTRTPALCAAGTRCKGPKRKGQTCLKSPPKLGEACNAMNGCKGRLVCDGTCKLGENAPCQNTPNSCANGLACVGIRRNKMCRPLRAEGRRCGTIGFLKCGPGLSCVHNKCVRGTQGNKKRCGRGLVCNGDLVCAGKGRWKRCVKPMAVGQKCGVDPYWVCAPGARCLRSRCREY